MVSCTAVDAMMSRSRDDWGCVYLKSHRTLSQSSVVLGLKFCSVADGVSYDPFSL